MAENKKITDTTKKNTETKKGTSSPKATTKKQSQKKEVKKTENTLIEDSKKLIINNKNKLILNLIVFPFGFLFIFQNRKKPYLLAGIYLITTLISFILFITIYNFLYYYS